MNTYTLGKINKTKSWFLEKTTQTDKPLWNWSVKDIESGIKRETLQILQR